jgi:hypothetical protein
MNFCTQENEASYNEISRTYLQILFEKLFSFTELLVMVIVGV